MQWEGLEGIRGALEMRVRFSSFVGERAVVDIEGGYTRRVYFNLPHRAMLCDLTKDEIFQLSEQCEELLANPAMQKTIYLGGITKIDEVKNKRDFEMLGAEIIDDEEIKK